MVTPATAATRGPSASVRATSLRPVPRSGPAAAARSHAILIDMYIDDCIEGTLAIADSGILDPINLGSSELVTVNQLVDLVEQIAGVHLRRSYNLSAPRGVHGRNSDNTLIRQALGWEPSTRLSDGMERTYRWIHDEYIRKHGD